MLEVTGPAFVKLGQWIAIRSALFPNDFCIVLCAHHHGFVLFVAQFVVALLFTQNDKPKGCAQRAKHGVASDNKEGGDPMCRNMSACSYMGMPLLYPSKDLKRGGRVCQPNGHNFVAVLLPRHVSFSFEDLVSHRHYFPSLCFCCVTYTYFNVFSAFWNKFSIWSNIHDLPFLKVKVKGIGCNELAEVFVTLSDNGDSDNRIRKLFF